MVNFLYSALIRIHVLIEYYNLHVSRKGLFLFPNPKPALESCLGIVQRLIVSVAIPSVVNPRPPHRCYYLGITKLKSAEVVTMGFAIINKNVSG